MHLFTVVILLAIAFPRSAAAEELPRVDANVDRAPRNYGNFRTGYSSGTMNGRPDLCLELAPVAFVSIEGCGTGSGFLHNDPEPELAHFAAKLRIASVRTRIGWVEPQVGLGFAELQVGKDDPGFQFGGVGPNGVETAGAELSLAARLLIPVGRGFEVIADLRLSLAYLPYAPDLVVPKDSLLPSIGASVGVGF